MIDDKDRVIDGKRTPDWTGGMTNTFTYKEFDLSFQAAFKQGQELEISSMFRMHWKTTISILII